MAFAIEWDKTGERYYETGVDRGVVYPAADTTPDESTGTIYGDGVAWNGLTTVTESPSGAESNPVYADNIKYLNLLSLEEFGGTIEAFTYPEEFGACIGEETITDAKGMVIQQQAHKTFGLCYRTLRGNDEKGTDLGYIIHIVYGCTASQSERARATVNESPEAMTFSFEFSTVPVSIENHKNVSHIMIDSTKATPTGLAALEDFLYGKAGGSGSATKGKLPTPAKLITLLKTST